MKATAEAEEREKMQRTACLEGRRLLAVRTAEKDGFWYTENLEGFGGGEPLSLESMAGGMECEWTSNVLAASTQRPSESLAL